MKARQPRLLFLSQNLPYPPDEGVKIRTFNVLKLLSASFDITALCFYKPRSFGGRTDVSTSLSTLGVHATIEAFPIAQNLSVARFAWDHLRSLVTQRAYTWYVYESPEFERRLLELLADGSFDLAHVDSLDLVRYLSRLRCLPITCVHHNVESLLLRRRAEAERSRWRRRYLLRQATLVEQEERFWCERVSLNVAVSEVDATALRRLAPGGRFIVTPNGVDIDEFTPGQGGEEGIIFVGGSTWFPNRDALDYFSRKVLPVLRRAGETAPISWVGRASKADQRRYRERYDINLTGYVSDIRPYVQSASCYIVPLRVGGGTRLKILEAWAMGKAVVSTAVGCEGLAAVDGENILIRDEPERFAEAILDVLRKADLRKKLGDNARHTVEQSYSWQVIGDPMIAEYRRQAR
jgi:glycosyltransferase involved in cell wall biosynthesis